MADLASMIEEAVQRDGLQELTVRVSRYGADGKTPECWQALAKCRDRMGGPWGVGILASPGAAIRSALLKLADTPAEEDIFG